MTEIHDAPLEQLIRWWNEPGLTPGEFEEEGALDEVAYALSRHRDEGVNLLKKFLNDKSHRRRAALYFLAWPDLIDEEILKALLAAYSSPDDQTKSTALWGFIHSESFVLTEAQIKEAEQSANERLAALAMVYRCRAKPEARAEILRNAIKDANPRTRSYACDEIGDFQVAELAEEMKNLLDDEDANVVRSAKSNLEFFD